MLYVIGTVGQQPRMYLNCDDGLGVTVDDAQRQLKTGEIYFLAPQQGGQGATINAAGNGFDAYVMPLATAQTQAWVAAKQYRDQMRNGGCVTPLGKVQTDTASQRLLDQKAASARSWVVANRLSLLGVKVTVGTWSEPWRMMDNTIVTHTAAQFVALHDAVIAHNTACQRASDPIRAKISAATTVAAVQAVDTTAGYPD